MPAKAAPKQTEAKVETKKTSKVETKVDAKVETKSKTVEKKTTETKSKEAVNQQTADAGLTLSVTAFKSWMKEFIGGEQTVKFSGGHIVLTSVNETLWKYLIEQTLKEVAKDNAGLYTLTRPAVRNAVLLNPDLNLFFGTRFEQFDNDMKYGSQYCVNQKTVAKFINEECGKNVNYDDSTYHLFVFLLLKASSSLTTAAHKMMQYANRKSVDDRAVLTALDLYFSGELGHLLRVRAEEAITSAKKSGTLDENETDESSEKSTDKTADKSKKTAKKESKVVEVEEEVEEEAGEEEAEEEAEEEEEEEEEEEPSPPPKKSNGKKQAK
jgi:hypothetical protein